MRGSLTPGGDIPRRVLIVRLSALGDVIHCLPALEALAQLWPAARFDWVVESLGAAVIEGHPRIDRRIMLPRKEWTRDLRVFARWPEVAYRVRHFVDSLREREYDLVVDFQGNLRSRWVCALTRHRGRVTHHPTEVKELSWLFRTSWPDAPSGHVHRVQKNLHLVRALGWTGAEPRATLPDLGPECRRLRSQLPTGETLILLHPFASAFGRHKEWPATHHAELARLLAGRGRRILVSHGPGERHRAERIVMSAGGACELAPTTRSARDFAALITSVEIVVAADTGALHLAVAAGVPAVGLYGPKDPVVYGPWQVPSRCLSAGVPCSPCTLRHCDHAICMQLLTPGSVAEAVTGLLGGVNVERTGLPERS